MRIWIITHTHNRHTTSWFCHAFLFIVSWCFPTTLVTIFQKENSDFNCWQVESCSHCVLAKEKGAQWKAMTKSVVRKTCYLKKYIYILQKKCRQIWCFQAANICRGCLAQPGEFYMRRDDEKAGGHSVTIWSLQLILWCGKLLIY